MVAIAPSCVVYLLHFKRGIRRTRKHLIRHYLGATVLGLPERLRRHEEGRGSALVREVMRRKIPVRVARVWQAKDRKDAFRLEIELKRPRRHQQLCPFCVGRAMRRGA